MKNSWFLIWFDKIQSFYLFTIYAIEKKKFGWERNIYENVKIFDFAGNNEFGNEKWKILDFWSELIKFRVFIRL